MVTNIGTFNYIRLTNNDFSQLLAIFADMKNEALKFENPKAVIHINEEVGGLPPHKPPEAYIIPYGMNNVFDGFAYADSTDDEVIIPDNESGFIGMNYEDFKNTYNIGLSLYYTGKDVEEKIKNIKENILNPDYKSSAFCFVEMLIGKNINSYKEIFFTECFRYYDEKREKLIAQLLENAISIEAENYQFKDSNVVEVSDNAMICRSTKGYYAVTPEDFYMATSYYSSIEDLKNSDILKIMNDIYKTNHNSV